MPLVKNNSLERKPLIVCKGSTVGFGRLHAFCINCRLYEGNQKDFPSGGYEIEFQKGLCPKGYAQIKKKVSFTIYSPKSSQ